MTLIDGTGKGPLTNMRVKIRGNRIQAVESESEPDIASPAETIIDGTGKYLIPGLWDAHVHLEDIGEVAIPILPTYGITSVRDMGGNPDWLLNIQRRIERGELIGPRVKFCGPMLEGKWEPKQAHDRARTDHWEVKTPEQAQATVKKLANVGVACLKMRSYADPATYFALAKAAREADLPLSGHAPWGIDPIESSNAGQRSYEHAYYPWPWKTLDADRRQQIENTFRKNSSLIVPTLIAWQTFRFDITTISALINDSDARSDPRLENVSPSLRENWTSGLEDLKQMKPGTPGWNKSIDDLYDQVAEMHDHGVGVMVGTDTGATMVFPGAALHQELKLLVDKCRFTPMDALLSATLIPAKFFRMEQDLGTVAPGKIADLVMLTANPLADIANIRFVDGVMLNGRWLDRAALDRLADKTRTDIRKLYVSHRTEAGNSH